MNASETALRHLDRVATENGWTIARRSIDDHGFAWRDYRNGDRTVGVDCGRIGQVVRASRCARPGTPVERIGGSDRGKLATVEAWLTEPADGAS